MGGDETSALVVDVVDVGPGEGAGTAAVTKVRSSTSP